jgi:sec-independent protein translocase protein TatA
MANLGTTEIIIIALVVIVLFGSKKLPDAARSIGRSLRIFKAETKGLRNDEDTAQATQAPAPAAASTPAPAPLPIEAAPVRPAVSTQPAGPAPTAAQAGTGSSANGPKPAVEAEKL